MLYYFLGLIGFIYILRAAEIDSGDNTRLYKIITETLTQFKS